MPLKSTRPLPPLPYGGDRKPGDPTPEKIAEACRNMAGIPASNAKDGQRRARVQTYGSSYRTHRDG